MTRWLIQLTGSLSAMARVWLVLVAAGFVLAASSCQDEEQPIAVVPLPREIESRWDLFPHRLSMLEVTFDAGPGGTGGVVRGLSTGGGFGVLDTPWVRYGVTVWRSRLLATEQVEVEIEIPPASEHEGEPFAVSREVVVPAGRLAGAEAVIAVIRGLRLSSDEYLEPPPFETDLDLPYDPVEGYTTQGLGVALDEPVLVGDDVSFGVRVRNSLGLSDRADMNAAVPRATTWVRVDVLLVGAFGEGAAVSAGETQYDLGAAEYGQNTVHEHASEDEQRVTIAGRPGSAQALFGLRAFDFWLNIEGRHDPECVVVQDEINSWGEEVSGPGRYVRVMSVRLHGESYDAATGAGEVLADLMLSNSSTYYEVGNVCLRARARVAMLQLDDPDASHEQPTPVDERLEPGEPKVVEVTW